MTEQLEKSKYFLSLVMMLASAAWQQLGKVPHPISGKTEKDLKSAQITIDILVMLKEKTKSNISSDEEKALANVISDLELNYADEINKNEPPKPVN
ncbi:MAG: DUF1844 domain-containing protein [Elusimicrobia bacterium]|nr:DUF1844 domain-containing protein [Elusimicrobiota bacterium]